jgi:Na+/H+-translocating membrane pyrophosphatase
VPLKISANLQDNIIQNYTEKPDYGRCVAIVASASLREMIKPGALAILSPMAVGEFMGVGVVVLLFLIFGAF